MGCGKSSVGRELARLLCCPFMDLDAVIEKAEGRTIPEIFASDGEAAFRRMEADTLHSLVVQPVGSVGPLPASWAPPPEPAAAGFSLQRSTGPFADRSRGWQNANSIHQADTPHNMQPVQCVLALGGGTVMTPECAEIVHEKTFCIYLRTEAETLAERLAGEADGRPMLKGNLMDRIHELMAQRAATYEGTAHMIIDTDGKTIEDIASEIHGILKNL